MEVNWLMSRLFGTATAYAWRSIPKGGAGYRLRRWAPKQPMFYT